MDHPQERDPHQWPALFDLGPAEDYRHPGFTFAGCNLGGEITQTCLGCGALVRESGVVLHQKWHEGVTV